ncbi:transmembrane protein, putative (macronuclear) [Tetrahymena thermophila SB210]|uniref:Transmembrane protein, putative n=1 Tax=Tetrahymena thermophila (strain SB210) TaxID=312017 RepID=W7XDJ8_TETTS|nr:transmembrane protein, putative [Tetrahymena thermophila SB210]EWS75647.1 transmembrane protein, putative [Tetrahymena thermophila SB210]|eukprot:XP_012651793.1 transmembrane protein, putative [Tetrahymena thermophila SB210]
MIKYIKICYSKVRYITILFLFLIILDHIYIFNLVYQFYQEFSKLYVVLFHFDPRTFQPITVVVQQKVFENDFCYRMLAYYFYSFVILNIFQVFYFSFNPLVIYFIFNNIFQLLSLFWFYIIQNIFKKPIFYIFHAILLIQIFIFIQQRLKQWVVMFHVFQVFFQWFLLLQ